MDNVQAAMAFFQAQGWSPHQAAAIVGNLMQESGAGLDPGAKNPRDPGTSIGIGQWNRERKTALFKFAGTQQPTFQQQLAFVQHELTGSEAPVGQRLKAAGNVQDATAAFIGYERPQGWKPDNPTAGHGWGNRLANATALAGQPQAQQGGSYSGGQYVPAFSYPDTSAPAPGGLLEADTSPSQEPADTVVPGAPSKWEAAGKAAQDLAKLGEQPEAPFEWLSPQVVQTGFYKPYKVQFGGLLG